MSEEFPLPSFLQGQSAAEIQRRMMANLPADIDKTEGGFPWDFTMPTALEAAELLQYSLPEAIKLMFPQWASGTYLDSHAELVGLTRKAANAASGYLTVSGAEGTVIPAGQGFAVPAVGNVPAIEFQTMEEAVIPASGTLSVYVTAVVAGTSGNVPAGSVSILSRSIRGVTAVTNPAHMTGGTAIESDDELRERILEFDLNSGASFVGCDADYIRWAKEIAGVGAVLVDTQYEETHPNWVRLVILDTNGEPANQQILDAVYNHIMAPDDRLQRLAPIGAILFVEAPSGITIDFKIYGLRLETNAVLDTVLASYKVALSEYYVTAKEENIVRYTRVCAALSGVAGVIDFDKLTMTNEYESVTIPVNGYPTTGEITVEDVTYGL